MSLSPVPALPLFCSSSDLYAYDSVNKTYMGIPATIRFYYFLPRSYPTEVVEPFPRGLRMLVGDPARKTPTGLASFSCQREFAFTNSLTGDSFNFNSDCSYGLKTDLFFPGCWNGRDLWKSDMSHMSYPAGGGYRDGPCPTTHPVRVPVLQLEYTWHTSQALGNKPLRGNLRWANGDTTGYGIHGDFVNGWDIGVLNATINDKDCGYSGNAM